MTCSKSLSIAITEPVMGEWWAFETSPSANQIGAINGTPLLPHGTAMQSTAGKILNGARMRSVNGATDFSYFDSAASANLLYDGNGATAYGWIFFDNGAPAIQLMVHQYDFYDAGAVRVGLMGWEFNGFASLMTVYVQSFPGAYSEFTFALAPTNGTWMFYRLFYDHVTKQVGLQLDNGIIRRSTAGVVTLPASATGLVAVMSFRATGALGANTAILDEVGFFPRFHSDAQASFVYNGGAGRTWPFVLP